MLALDGVEVEAAEAGTVSVPIGSRTVRLVVRRIPTALGGRVRAGDLLPGRDQRRGHLSCRPLRPAGARCRTVATGWTSIARGTRSAPTARRSPAPRRGAGTPSRRKWRPASATSAEGSVHRPRDWRRNERGRASGVGVHGRVRTSVLAGRAVASGARSGGGRAAVRPDAGTARGATRAASCATVTSANRSPRSRLRGDTVVLEMADYAATITARSRRGLAHRHLPQRRQPRTAGDPVSRRARNLAAGARATASAGPVGRHLDRRLRHQPAGVRASQRRRRAGRHDHLQHRRLRPLRGNREG